MSVKIPIGREREEKKTKRGKKATGKGKKEKEEREGGREGGGVRKGEVVRGATGQL